MNIIVCALFEVKSKTTYLQKIRRSLLCLVDLASLFVSYPPMQNLHIKRLVGRQVGRQVVLILLWYIKLDEKKSLDRIVTPIIFALRVLLYIHIYKRFVFSISTFFVMYSPVQVSFTNKKKQRMKGYIFNIMTNQTLQIKI